MAELILGGQRSGKSARAEALALAWLNQSPGHAATLIATAQPWDDEMRQRIARHQRDRAERLPRMATVEEPLQLAKAIAACSTPQTLVVVDCLTLWLTNLLMPVQGPVVADVGEAVDALVRVTQAARGPLVYVSNEIGLGVIPLGREVRQFVDALGQLNQRLARTCGRVTLMAAGLPLVLKEPA